MPNSMHPRRSFGVGMSCGLLWLALLVMSQGCGSATTPLPPPSPGMPGGYFAVSKADPQVIKAAEFALKDQSALGPKLKLLSIESASSQVVAGTNIRLVMKVAADGVPKLAEAVVYIDLAGVCSVTDWAWVDSPAGQAR